MVTNLIKIKLMKKVAGVFKGSMAKDDVLWKDVLKKKSRKGNIIVYLPV